MLLIIYAIAILQAASGDSRLTVTENLIRREVMALGGEWEGGDKIKLLAFLGPRFRTEHFEMLDHLKSIKEFYCSNLSVQPSCLRSLSHINDLKSLEILDCEQLVDGLDLVGEKNLRQITILRLHGCMISTKTFETIASMTSLEKLELFDAKFEAMDVLKILKCKELIHLQIQSTCAIGEELVNTIQESLPACNISITTWPDVDCN